MASALNSLDRAATVDNRLLRESLVHDTDIHRLTRANYRPPSSLSTMNEEGLLYREDLLLFYHRRSGTLELENPVYVVSQ